MRFYKCTNAHFVSVLRGVALGVVAGAMWATCAFAANKLPLEIDAQSIPQIAQSGPSMRGREVEKKLEEERRARAAKERKQKEAEKRAAETKRRAEEERRSESARKRKRDEAQRVRREREARRKAKTEQKRKANERAKSREEEKRRKAKANAGHGAKVSLISQRLIGNWTWNISVGRLYLNIKGIDDGSFLIGTLSGSHSAYKLQLGRVADAATVKAKLSGKTVSLSFVWGGGYDLQLSGNKLVGPYFKGRKPKHRIVETATFIRQ